MEKERERERTCGLQDEVEKSSEVSKREAVSCSQVSFSEDGDDQRVCR